MNQTMKQNKILTALTAGFLAFGLTACSGDLGSSDGSSVGGQSLDGNVDFNKLNAEMEKLDFSMGGASDKLNALNVLQLSSQGDTGRNLAQQIKAALQQIVTGVNESKTLIAKYRLDIQARLAQLNLEIPKHQEIKEKLDEALAYLDNVESYLDQAMAEVIQFIDKTLLKVDGLVESISSTPLKVIASLVWSNVKVEIVAARNELAAG